MADSIGIVSSASGLITSGTSSSQGLSYMQRRKILQFESDYTEKKISLSQKDLRVAEVKASVAKPKKVVQEKQTDVSGTTSGTGTEISKKLMELLKDKDTGNSTKNNTGNSIYKFNNSTESLPGMLIDKIV
jgi:hypothetical protein